MDPHLLLPPTTETNGEMAEYCPADDEFFRVTPRASLQRDWLSSPEDEIENDWRSGSDSTGRKFEDSINCRHNFLPGGHDSVKVNSVPNIIQNLSSG